MRDKFPDRQVYIIKVSETLEYLTPMREKLYNIIVIKNTLKETTNQTDQHPASLSSRTYVLEDKMTRH